jgi:hypothetical protein
MKTKERILWKALAAVAFIIATCLIPKTASAQYGEVSLQGSYSRSNYSETSYQWTRTWVASVGYNFGMTTGIEFEYRSSTVRTFVEHLQDTTFHDQVYSLNLMVGILSAQSSVQPYFKVGIGQLNRDAEGTYSGGGRPPAIYDSLTVVLGVGTKIFFSRKFSVTFEGTSYLSGGNIGSWKDNFAFSTGLSVYF